MPDLSALLLTAGVAGVAGVWAVWGLADPARTVIAVIVVAGLAPRLAAPATAWGVGGISAMEFGVALALLAALVNLARGAGRFRPGPVGVAGALFVAVLLLAYSWSDPVPVPQQQRAFAGLVAAVLLGTATGSLLSDQRDHRRAIAAFIVVAAVVACGALLLNAAPEAVARTALGALEPLGYPGDETVIRLVAGSATRRATGTLVDPNLLGGFLAVTLPLILAQWTAQRELRSRAALTAAAVVVAWALVATYSRAAWLGAAVGVACTALLLDRRLVLIPVAVAALAAAGPWGEPLRERLLEGLAWSDPASVMRLAEYRDTLQRIAEHPVLGIGFGTPAGMNPLLRVSSAYLLVAEQAGLFGLAAFIAVPATLLWIVVRRSRANRGDWAGQAGAVGSVAAALAIGLLDHYFINYGFLPSVALFWTLVGLAAWPPGVRRAG